MTTLINTQAHTKRPAASSSLISRVFAMFSLARQRNDLRNLTDVQLDDLGITRAQAETEGRRAIWDAPANWKG